MGKYYCDYCDVHLTHDSASVRRAHNAGRNHLTNVREYYASLGHDKAQDLIDQITKMYESGSGPPPGRAFPGGPPGMGGMGMRPPFGGPPGMGGPPPMYNGNGPSFSGPPGGFQNGPASHFGQAPPPNFAGGPPPGFFGGGNPGGPPPGSAPPPGFRPPPGMAPPPGFFGAGGPTISSGPQMTGTPPPATHTAAPSGGGGTGNQGLVNGLNPERARMLGLL